jgi:hypothetical protein
MAGERRSPALVRAVNALMRSLGGASVQLRIPVATADGLQRELGIAASACQGLQVAPVMVRHFQGPRSAAKEVDGREEIKIQISPSALDAVTPAVGMADGFAFLRSVEQVVYAERVFAVTDVSADRFAGVAYMYHVTAVANTQ